MTSTTKLGNVEVGKPLEGSAKVILTPEALDFVAELHRVFEPRRQELLRRRRERVLGLSGGHRPGFLAETRAIRDGEWKVAPAPADLDDRRVEITGPADAKMMINALNSGAKVFM
ncbi:MAG: malate synthase A, partial [Acidobacteria bacterium]|nr:malate synthase A [Acidobacteriota bacterium]